MCDATSKVSFHFFAWLSTNVNLSVEATVCYRITKPENFMPYFPGLVGIYWRNLHRLLKDTSCSSVVTHSCGLYHFLKFEIKRSQMYLNAAMWSVCRRNSLILLSSNLKKRRMSSFFAMFLPTWLSCT